jgi:hypothetical protein
MKLKPNLLPPLQENDEAPRELVSTVVGVAINDLRRLMKLSFRVKVVALCREYGAQAFTDQHESQAVVTRARELGLKTTVYAMTRERKVEAFKELRDQLYTGGLVLPNNSTLLDELRRVKPGSARAVLGSSCRVRLRVTATRCRRSRLRSQSTASAASLSSMCPKDASLGRIIVGLARAGDGRHLPPLAYGILTGRCPRSPRPPTW